MIILSYINHLNDDINIVLFKLTLTLILSLHEYFAIIK